MIAAELTIDIEQGATFEKILTIKNTLSAAVDITGYTFAGQLRKTFETASPIATFTFDLQDQVTDTGKVKWSLSDTDTSAITVDPVTNYKKRYTEYVYDIEMTKPDGTVVRLLEGIARVYPEVTR